MTVATVAFALSSSASAAQAMPIRTGTFKGTARVVFHAAGTTLLGRVTLRIARESDGYYEAVFVGSVACVWNSYPSDLSDCKVTNPTSLAVSLKLNATSYVFSAKQPVDTVGFDIHGRTTGTMNLLCTATDGSTYTESGGPADDQLLYQAPMRLNISHIGGPHTFSSDNPPGMTVTLTLPG